MQDRNGDHDSSEDCLSIGLTSHKRHSWRLRAFTDIHSKTDLIEYLTFLPQAPSRQPNVLRCHDLALTWVDEVFSTKELTAYLLR